MKKILLLSLVFFLFSFLRAEAWTRNFNFENGTIGTQAQGSDAFSETVANVTYNNTYSHDGSKSAKFAFGPTGCPDSDRTALGVFTFPTGLPAGGEVWVRYYSRLGTGWTWNNGFWKVMRIDVSGYGMVGLGDGWGGVFLGNEPALPEGYISSNLGAQNIGEWVGWELYLKASSVAGQGITRVWRNGNLVFNDTTHETMRESGSYLSEAQFWGTINCPGISWTQDAWVDDIVITTDTPSARDAQGNPMIGTSGYIPPACTPSWQCDAWSACSNNSQTRTCTDSNNCGVNTGKPATNQSCTSSCTPSWQCSNWNACSNSSQSRTCTDSNNCGTTSGKPATTQSCQSAPDPVEVDSTYSGYSKDKIDDNVINAQGGESSTWASGESSTDPHWIELNFTSPKTLNYLDIYWAFNSYRNAFATSQEVQVQKWNGSSYETIATVTNSSSQEKSSVSFSSITTSKLRLYQPANKGYADYSTVMWVAEVDYGMGSVVERKYNNNDFSSLVTDWLQTKTSSADINSDGTVNTRDLGIMMSKWGS